MTNQPSSAPPRPRTGPPPVPGRASPAPRAPRKPERRPPPKRRTWRSVIGYGALGAGCIVAGAAAFLVVAAPVDLLRDRIIDRVKARSGLDLSIGGASSLSLFPRPSLSLADIALSAPDGDRPAVLSAAKLDAEVSLWSLFVSRPAVDRITVYQPVIEVTRDLLEHPPGRRPASSAPNDSPANSAMPAASPAEPRLETAARVAPLGTARLDIVDGTVRYRHGDGELTEATAVTLTLSTEGRDAPLGINGSATIRGTPVTVSGTVSSVAAIAARQPVQVAATLSGPLLSATFNGKVAPGTNNAVAGSLNIEAPSIQAVAAWLGRPLAPNASGEDRLAFSANVQSVHELLSFSDLRATLGPSIVAGNLTLDPTGPRPRLSGILETSELNFGKLLLKPAARPAQRARPASGAVPTPALPPPAQPRSRGDRHDWSDEPINLAILGTVDTDLRLTAERIVYKDLKAGPGRVSVVLDSGNGNLKLEDVQLYGGRATGVLALDATSDMLVTNADLNLQGVDIRPLLGDALDFPWLEGRAHLTVALAGQGASERQIVEGLNGKVSLTSRDGAIAGADVGKIVRNIQSMRFPKLALSPAEKTPFTELAATFEVTNGVASNKDLRLTGPHLNLQGDGAVDLGQRRLDYTMRTKVGAAPDSDATLKVRELEVPLTIKGPWDKPDFGIQGQEQLTGTIRQIGKNLRSQEVKDALRGLLKGDGEKRVKPRELLDKLLKKD